jgi:molybdopterin-containing oxidoreductase family iron-sulfur binding subunit
MNRRDFLKFVGMASSATVLASCGVEKSSEKLIPMLVPADEDYLPGEAIFKSSTCTECPANCGISVKMVEFNPIKLEGIEKHPLNDGALCIRGQASLMRLYHPKRVRGPLTTKKHELVLDQLSGSPLQRITWEEAYKLVLEKLREAAQEGKKSVYFSGRTSGSLSALIDEFCNVTATERLPEYEPYSHANLREAYNILFDRREIPAYRIENSDFLLTVGADVIETFVSPVNYAVQIQRAKEKNQNFRWVHLEPHASLTGFRASHRKVLKAGSEPYLLAFLANYIVSSNLAENSVAENIRQYIARISPREVADKTGLSSDELNLIAQQLAAAQNPLVIAGGVSTMQANGLETAVLAGLLQWITGMTASTVDFTHAEDYANVGSLKDVKRFANRLTNDEIGVAFVVKTDHLFETVPAEIQLRESFKKATFRVALTDVITEDKIKDYADNYDLILPLSHSLESWGDVEPRRGLINIMQPVLKEQLFDTRSEGDILLSLTQTYRARESNTTYEEWLKNRWTDRFGEARISGMLTNGYTMENGPPVNLSLSGGSVNRFLARANLDNAASGATLFAMPSIRAFDGRSKALPLTTEIPDPLTSVSYGKWVSVSEASAQELSLSHDTVVNKNRDEVRVEASGTAIKYGSMVQPGLPKDVYTVQWEQVNPAMLSYDKRSGECLARIDGINVEKTGKKRPLAIMAGSTEQGHRNIIPKGEPHHHGQEYLKGDETLYPVPADKHPLYRWAISVDMESCIGCSACVAACYMENNIPCVGEEEHLTGREMSWIRVQPYYHQDGSMDNLVMMCQQCDFAPCENVCPVFATYHNEEGLNVMVYNRCVGTRYCHNNCPYKVRRFNWFDWTDRGAWAEPMTRMLNPDIWVRPKGVMEKCTFCVQRIRKAKDVAKDENRTVRDGEVIPACAQTCPTNAITFGNILDEESQVYKKSQTDRKFRVLETLGASPAVHYLRKEEKV